MWLQGSRRLGLCFASGFEQKGFYLRLDSCGGEPTPEGGPIGDISDLSRALDWHVRSSFEFREVHHINLQEARAWKHEVRTLASDASRLAAIRYSPIIFVRFAGGSGRHH